MDNEELIEVLKLLEEQGWKPMACDTPVPFFDSRVSCGLPTDVGDVVKEHIMMPHQLVDVLTEFYVTTQGDSMKDINITSGDMVKVKRGVSFHDGDIVVVMIDGEALLKTFYTDENGDVWLVPQNKAYKPILLKESQNVWLVGVVTEVIKTTPRVSFRSCQKIVNEAKSKNVEEEEITQERVEEVIREIAPQIGMVRMWYAVFRSLVDLNVYGDREYDAFCKMVAEMVPDHNPQPNRIELQRMAVDSMAKPVVLWSEANAPVHGKRFDDYLAIARSVKKLVENS